MQERLEKGGSLNEKEISQLRLKSNEGDSVESVLVRVKSSIEALEKRRFAPLTKRDIQVFRKSKDADMREFGNRTAISLAGTFPGGVNRTIYINMNLFFNGQEALTLVHEASHFNSGGNRGTRDNEKRGLDNAEDFAKFIMQNF